MMIDLLKLLPTLLRKAGDSEEARQQAVFAAWIGVVGQPLRQFSYPVRLERKTLIVAVSNTTWQSQLHKMRGHILFKLNSLLGAPTVTTLEFVINPEIIQQLNQAPPPVHFVAPEKYQQALRQDAEAIPKPELREAFLRAAGKCLDRRYR
ncbi:MAG: DUF721 domain-containing protein [Acidobacteria bacterium]|nr:DUF721 domain-containing protein [Acidobacteriota bacterium]